MGFLDKVREVAASTVGGTVVSVKENSKLVGIRSELTSLNDELRASFEMIGRRFVEFVLEEASSEQAGSIPDFGVGDVVRHMQPKLSKKRELEEELARIERELADAQLLQEKQQLERDFAKEKEKLDKAKKMGVVSDSEYDAMIAKQRKKIDNFDEVRRLEKQRDMGLLSASDFAKRVAELS